MAVVARKHKSGIVYWVATSHPGGKHWERSGRDKRTAERLDAQRRREVKAGAFSPSSSGSHVRTYLAGWLAARTVRTVETERALVQGFVLCRDWFASLPLRDVRPRHLVQLVAELKGSERARGGLLSPKSVSNILGILRTAFRDAEIAELVDANPVVLPRGTLTRKGRQDGPGARRALAKCAARLFGGRLDVGAPRASRKAEASPQPEPTPYRPESVVEWYRRREREHRDRKRGRHVAS